MPPWEESIPSSDSYAQKRANIYPLCYSLGVTADVGRDLSHVEELGCRDSQKAKTADRNLAFGNKQNSCQHFVQHIGEKQNLTESLTEMEHEGRPPVRWQTSGFSSGSSVPAAPPEAQSPLAPLPIPAPSQQPRAPLK